ncbi:MAG: J domain-containing protein, partial [Elainellaceae cyanobacterium]
MPHTPFTEEWIQQFSDPYAVLGVSVSADDRRILKRFRTLAKLLHPDSHHLTDPKEKAIAGQVLAKLINPTYQRLKQEKGRAESLALLRFRVRRMTRDEPLAPTSEKARRLLRTAVPEVEVFYEQVVAELAEAQLSSLSQFDVVTKELSE